MTTCTACNGTGIRFLPDAEYHPIQPCFCGAAATEREEKTYAYTQAQYNALLAERDAALAEVKRLLPSDTTETEDTMIIPLPIMDAIERVLEPIISLDPFPDDDSELIDQFKYTPIEVQGEDLVNLFIARSKCLPSDPEHERLCMAEVERLRSLLSRMSWYANHPGSTGIDEIDEKRDKDWVEFNHALLNLKGGE